MDDYLDTSDYDGPASTAQAAGIPYTSDYVLPGDSTDAAQMAAWNTAPAPAQAAGVQWWQGLVQYGVSKAIDNTFSSSPTGVQGNVYPGSGAGLNGATYTQRPTGAGGGVLSVKATAGGSIGGIPVLWIAAAVAAFLIIKH
jgi:hypothetical protein